MFYETRTSHRTPAGVIRTHQSLVPWGSCYPDVLNPHRQLIKNHPENFRWQKYPVITHFLPEVSRMNEAQKLTATQAFWPLTAAAQPPQGRPPPETTDALNVNPGVLGVMTGEPAWALPSE